MKIMNVPFRIVLELMQYAYWEVSTTCRHPFHGIYIPLIIYLSFAIFASNKTDLHE